jgi:hypothetical protein
MTKSIEGWTLVDHGPGGSNTGTGEQASPVSIPPIDRGSFALPTKPLDGESDIQTPVAPPSGAHRDWVNAGKPGGPSNGERVGGPEQR